MSDLEGALGKLTSRVDGLDDRVDSLELNFSDIEAALDSAKNNAAKALGNIDVLVQALGGYSEAGTLNKIDELDAIDSTLNANIEALNDSLRANVERLRDKIEKTKEEIEAAMVSKEELPALIQEQIRFAIEDENGIINQSISEAISNATKDLITRIEDIEDKLAKV